MAYGYVRAISGAPIETPDKKLESAAIVFDQLNDKLYVFNSKTDKWVSIQFESDDD